MDQKTELNALKKELEDARSQIEQFAREAKIQAALEVVRAASLAMRNTSELQDVINAVGRQFKSLAILNTGGVFVIINEELDHNLHVWGFGDTASYSQKVHVEYIDRPIHTHLLHRIKTTRGLMTEVYSNEEKIEYFTHLFRYPPYNATSPEHQQKWFERPGGYTRSCYISEHTTLFMINHHGRVFSQEENQILSRFGAVFEQSYIRFLDLKQAEKQAHNAKVEAALERVRAASMTMQKSTELPDVAVCLLDQFEQLALPSMGTAITIMNEEDWTFRCYFADNTSAQYRKLSITPMVNSDSFWISEESIKQYQQGVFEFTLEAEEDKIAEWIEWVHGYLSEERAHRLKQLELKKVYFHCICYHRVSNIVFSSISPLTHEHWSTIRRLAETFGQSYRRFLDLQKAEVQTREAQIEAGLEKVRAASMAMHSSRQINNVVKVLYAQLKKLIKSFDIANIQVNMDSTRDLYFWNGLDVDMYDDMYQIPEADHPLFHEIHRAWNSENGAVDLMLSKAEKDAYFDIAFKFMPTSADRKKMIYEANGMTLIGFFNQNAAVNIIRYDQHIFSEENKRVVTRFSKVFEQTYTRFLDLQKAEKQAREAQIEAALERVRAASLAMHRSEDLPQVALTFFNQIEHLEIPINAASINLVNESKESYRLYFANRHQVGITNELLVKDFWFATESFRRLQKGEKEFTKICEGEYLKAWIDYIKRDISKERGVQLEEMNPSKSYIHSVQFHELSHIIFTSISPLSQSVLTVLRRMTQAFGMSYIRFLDLQKAEEQAREAQIEAAMERVRSRSMAMHQSDELREVVSILYQEIGKLGLADWGCNLQIFDTSEKTMQIWLSEDENHIHPKSYFFRDAGHPHIKTQWNKWEQKETYFTISLSGPVKKSYDDYVLTYTDFRHFPEKIKANIRSLDQVYFNFAWMKYGFLVGISVDRTMEDVEFGVLGRFAKVFEQTYTRFRDIQKAEAQARDAQVEAALERVRARTMAMHASEEFRETIGILFTQLNLLDFDIQQCSLTIVDELNSEAESWQSSSAQSTLPMSFKMQFPDDPYFRENIKESLLKKEGYSVIEFKNEGKKQFDEYIFGNTPVGDAPKEVIDFMKSHNKIVLCRAYMRYGFIETVSNTSKLNPDKEVIIRRFSKVFEQTYTRFLDLKKAEAQAREAQIETALERVRAKSLAMHKSEELADLSLELVKQVQALGIETWFCAFNIYDDDPKGSLEWGSNGVGTFPMYRTPREGIFLKYFEAGQKGETLLVNEIGEDECPAHYQYLCTLPGVGDQLLQMQREGIPFPTSQIDHVVFFQYGYLIFITYKPIPESLHIFKRFAKVFEQGYTRFLDLKKAEAQAREAQIEAALEKIRSSALAMHTSDDLLNVVTVLRRQMHELGEESLESTIIHLYHENADFLSAFWAFKRPDGSDDDIITGEAQVPTDNLWCQAVLKKYHSGKDSYSIISEGSMLQEWYQVLAKIAPQTVDYDQKGNIIIPEKLFYYFSKFSGGALLVITEEEAVQNVIDLQQKAAKVFGLAYQRYSDLKLAEEQAILSKKEASLDRIRGQIASMRSVEDLQQITPLIWKELTILEIPFIRCGIFIMNPDNEQIQMYFSTPSGESVRSIEIPFNTTHLVEQTVHHWREKLIYIIQWTREQFIEWTHDLINRRLIEDEDSYYKDQPPPEHMVLHFIPFEQGMLYVGSLSELADQQKNLLQSISDVFSVAYARYEDFKVLENTLRELRSTQDQLIHSEKMASLGELTAGIAHEIQNPLNFVNNFSEIGVELIEEIEEELQNNDPIAAKEILSELIQNLQKIHHHGERASGIVRGMLDHSRAKSDEKSLTDVNQLCDEYLRLAYHGLRAKNKSFQANFRLDADPQLPKIMIASQDIGRVLLNLINNGFQATLEKSKNSNIDYRPELLVKTVRLENSIQIHVIDNGPGIPEEIQEKIFQPFFTTKPTGVGTGLGLSLAYDIIKSHGGKIAVESAPGKGTNFIVSLPIQQETGAIPHS